MLETDAMGNCHGDTRPLPSESWLVHATVHEISGQGAEADPLTLGKLFRRRLTRLERVLNSFGGVVIKDLSQGFLAAFDTAEIAVQAACEMQRRCAVIPQISATQIALRIGIDVGEASASALAGLVKDACLLISATVASALPDELAEKAVPMTDQPGEFSARTLDWDSVPMMRLPVKPPVQHIPGVVSVHRAEQRGLLLRRDGKVWHFTTDRSIVTIGRDASNDLMIDDQKASRKHCRIIYKLGSYVLVDLSLNGTYLMSETAEGMHVLKSMLTLPRRGRINFGKPADLLAPEAFEFEIVD